MARNAQTKAGISEMFKRGSSALTAAYAALTGNAPETEDTLTTADGTYVYTSSDDLVCWIRLAKDKSPLVKSGGKWVIRNEHGAIVEIYNEKEDYNGP